MAKLFGVEAPEKSDPPIDWVCTALSDLCKDRFDRLFIFNPDAIAMWLYRAYPDAFEPVLKHTQITIPFKTVYPAWTPICFASMYTGVSPEVHGIGRGQRRNVPIDSLFDALIRAEKRVAIVTEQSASMSRLWEERAIDFYRCKTEGEIMETTLNLIIEDKYDVLIVYTYMFDKQNHFYGPDDKKTVAALYNQTAMFDHLVSSIRRNWSEHNTIISFSPDHGVHACHPGGKRLGDHGTDNPLDANILHYIGTVLKKNKPELLL